MDPQHRLKSTNKKYYTIYIDYKINIALYYNQWQYPVIRPQMSFGGRGASPLGSVPIPCTLVPLIFY